MTPIEYVGHFDAVDTASGAHFERGTPVDCDPDLASALLERPDFREAKPADPTPKEKAK